MKKMFWILGIALALVVVSPKVVLADELQEVMDKYALSGEKLNEFERNEQKSIRMSRSTVNDTEQLRTQYNELVKQGIFGQDVTFDMYVQLANIKPPTDPVVPSARSVAGNPKAGDILVTNGTMLNGLTGHAGIFLGDGTILSIQGGGYTPRAMGILEWAANYMSKKGQWTKIYRPASKYRPTTAAQWAINNYRGKNYSYGINTRIYEKNPTYCSKIVWQAYYYASAAPQVGGMKIPAIASPYDLPNYFNTKATHVGTWGG